MPEPSTRLTSFGLPLVSVMIALCAMPARASMFKDGGFEIFGDFRARIEHDWDSQNSSGIERNDRTRVRVRARIGIEYAPDEAWEFGLRLRTGSDLSQQSPHVTVLDLDDNETGPAHYNLDKWYARARCEHGGWAWVGRNSLPFWKQNELLWDDDVTPAGLALGYSRGVGDDGNLVIQAGYFSLPEGMQEFYGSMATGQVVYSRKGDGVGLTIAAGLLRIDADPPGDGTILISGNDIRDYSIATASVQVRLETGGRGLVLGADLMDNSEDYVGDPDAGETGGYVASVRWGGTKDKGDWLLAYYYASIEKFAVNNAFSQDDWVRWGNGPQTRASDLEGHELRFAYGLRKNMNVVARLYLVEAITSVEDGSRFRVDFNYKL